MEINRENLQIKMMSWSDMNSTLNSSFLCIDKLEYVNIIKSVMCYFLYVYRTLARTSILLL